MSQPHRPLEAELELQLRFFERANRSILGADIRLPSLKHPPQSGAVAAASGAAPPPLFVGGQSLGGLVAALAVLRDQQRWAGLLVCSPALDVEWTPVLRQVGRARERRGQARQGQGEELRCVCAGVATTEGIGWSRPGGRCPEGLARTATPHLSAAQRSTAQHSKA